MGAWSGVAGAANGGGVVLPLLGGDGGVVVDGVVGEAEGLAIGNRQKGAQLEYLPSTLHNVDYRLSKWFAALVRRHAEGWEAL